MMWVEVSGVHADNGVDRRDSTILWLVLEHFGINRGMNAFLLLLLKMFWLYYRLVT